MSAQPLVDTPEDLVENALIRFFNTDAVAANCRPDHWDTDREYRLPNLFVKCSIAEQLIPGQQVYAFACEVALEGKPKRFSVRKAWRAVRDMIDHEALHVELSDSDLTIGSNAEDIKTQPGINGTVRRRAVTFTLRGFSNS